MKTVKEWLETIADKDIREAAISQIDEEWRGWPKGGLAEDLAAALYYFADWDKTKEYSYYWNEIWLKAHYGTLKTREVSTKKNSIVDDYLEKQEQEIKENQDAFTYAWNAQKYTKTEQEDGTIILKPKKKVKESEEKQGFSSLLNYDTLTNYEERLNDYQFSFFGEGGKRYVYHFQLEKKVAVDSSAQSVIFKLLANIHNESNITNCSVTLGTNYITTEGKKQEPKIDYDKMQKDLANIATISGRPVQYDADLYDLETKDDGTIILKPKKRKVWIEVYEYDGYIQEILHRTKDSLDESIKLGSENGEILLEVIEREYPINKEKC